MCYKYMKMTYFIILLIVVPDDRSLKCRQMLRFNVLQNSQFIYVFLDNECLYPLLSKQFTSGKKLKS